MAISTVYSAPEKTTSDYYEIIVKLDIQNNSSEYTHSLVTVTPYLRRVQTSATRYQHRWNVHFTVDYVYRPEASQYYTGTGHNALPNDTAELGVVGNGELYMKVNQWYQWGDSHTWTIVNDGNRHYFGVRMECVDTNPKGCPKNDYCYASVTLANYQQPTADDPAPAPIGLYTTFDPLTRELNYYWDDASCEYIKLRSNWYDINNNLIKEDWVAPMFFNYEKPIKETIPDNVAKVKYEVINVSSTGNTASSGAKDATWYNPNTGANSINLPSNNRIRVKVGNEWKKAIPWVKTASGWKMVLHTYINDNGTWKRTTT